MQRHGRSYLFLLIDRTVLFSFIMSSAVLVLYILGNYQEFLDTTQTLLLKILTVSVSFEVLVSIYYLGFLIFYAVQRRRRYIFRILFGFLSLVFCAVVLMLTKLITSWLTG